MITSSKIFPEKIVLLITEDGTIIEVLHDTFDICSNQSESTPSFIEYLKSDSVEKGCLFVERIKKNGVAYDWELQMKKPDFTSLFNFSGVKTETGIVLIGLRLL